jgi:hypothetical protein
MSSFWCCSQEATVDATSNPDRLAGKRKRVDVKDERKRVAVKDENSWKDEEEGDEELFTAEEKGDAGLLVRDGW